MIRWILKNSNFMWVLANLQKQRLFYTKATAQSLLAHAFSSLSSPLAIVILPFCFKLWSENYTQMHSSFPGHSNFEEHRSSPGTKSFFPGLLFPGALALSLRPVGMVAPAPASHSGYAPGEEWSSLERLRCHSRLKQSLRLSLPWQRGGYYLQSPLLSGPGAS